MAIDTAGVRRQLDAFNFRDLFIEDLGWSQPLDRKKAELDINGTIFQRVQIAQLSGVVVFEITAKDGAIPDAKTRRAIHTEIAKSHHENLLIFVDGQRSQSLWYWVKREDKKSYPREHLYIRGQPADLLLSKITAMVFDISDFDEAGNVPVIEVANRLKKALDVERVTKKFYKEFQEQHGKFLELIEGISDERDRRWYARRSRTGKPILHKKWTRAGWGRSRSSAGAMQNRAPDMPPEGGLPRFPPGFRPAPGTSSAGLHFLRA